MMAEEEVILLLGIAFLTYAWGFAGFGVSCLLALICFGQGRG
jgi:hypothetical protein